MTRLEPGLEFLPHLTLLRPLGRGGMSEVWVARDASRGEEVVAKVLPPDAPEPRIALLRREARLVRKVHHPGIVPVYGFETGPHGSAVLSRHMSGGDASRLRGATPLTIVRLGREVAEALAHLHGLGVVHRDVKPTNVLLDESGRAHLGDFGIAAVTGPDDEGLVVHGGGSRATMSPQQRAGEPAQTTDDVYALGTLLYDLLSGRPPFPPEATDDEIRTVPPPPLDPPQPIPDRLRALVTSMLAKTPEGRPRDVAAVAEALHEIEEELSPPAPASRAPDVRLQAPPRVPDVAVVAPRERTPVAAPASPRPAKKRGVPLSNVALLGGLALAVLFVVLVLPRLARSPASSGGAEAPAERVASPGDAAVPEAPPPPPSEPETPPHPAEDPPPLAEATPPPAARRDPPRAEPPRPRPAPPRSTAAEPGEKRAQEGFAAAMSEAQSAFDRGDWAAARQALVRASAIQPRSPALIDARRRVEEAERTALLARHRDAARGFEEKEDWRRAVAEYEGALKVDPAVAFALEGRDRAARRAALDEKLAFHVAHPLRLATDTVAGEAERFLQQAREIDPRGPRLRQQITALERALVDARAPVAVVLESDGKTEIVVHKVGRLGAFTRKTLDLRPGTYTVVGTRSGYRDVRRRLEVKPAAAPPPLVVRCEEAI